MFGSRTCRCLLALGALLSLAVGRSPLHANAVNLLASEPALAGISWTAICDQFGAEFGLAVATAGDVNGDGYADVIVGAPLYDTGEFNNNGRAYVYYGSAAGLGASPAWSTQGSQAEAQYGATVATAGDVNGDGYADVIVGAPHYTNGQGSEGAFYVYHGSPMGLSQTPARIVESDQTGALLGCAVSTAGDVNGDGYDDLIVGAWGLASEAGAAYVYYGSASGIGASPAWTKTGAQSGAAFGYAVGTAGDVNGDGYADVIVGAPQSDSPLTDEGAAYVYHGSASGLSASPNWTAKGGQARAAYGHAVDTAGDVNADGYSDIIVGARTYDDGQIDEGRVMVYLGHSNGVRSSPIWAGQNNWGYGQLGTSAGPAGDVNGDGYADVVAGAPYYTNGQTNEGAAYVYQGFSGGMNATVVWSQEPNKASYRYGQAVGAAGDVNGDGYGDVIIGAPGAGRAYVVCGGPTAPAAAPAWVTEGNLANFGYGRCVASAGDVNGDGYADVIVGSSYLANVDDAGGGEVSDGRVDVYLGTADGLPSNPDWTMTADQSGACFGISVASAGDVNADGYADVIVGAFLYDHTLSNEGAAFVYYGSPTGLASSPAWSGYGGRALAYFGRSVASAGDLNGDGYSDIVVGAYGYTHGQADEGAAFVFYGSPTGPSPSADWLVESNRANAWYGYSVASAGDVNLDGYSDVIVGARRYTNAYTSEGAAFVYHGSASGLATVAAWTAYGGFDVGYCTCPESVCGIYTHCVGEFGCSVAGAGDVNGDGYSDVVIGARKSGQYHTWAGRAYVFHGSASGLQSAPAWLYEATNDNNSIKSELGYCVATAGDVNGDGYSDVIVGANHYRAGDPYQATDEGRAYIFLGTAAGLDASPAWDVTGDVHYACLGQSVATAGDVNGDGYADVIVSAPTYGNGQQNEGRAYFHFGNGGPGVPLRARVVRLDLTTPIQPLGYADAPTSVPLRLTAQMPLGREAARVEWQLAPAGTLLGASGTLAGAAPAWTDARLGGKLVVADMTDLQPSTPYHWRARLRYRPGNRLGAVTSRWLHSPASGAQETDLRTPARIISTQSVALAQGWNLVSFSGQPLRSGLPITRVADILLSIEGDYDLVQRYDANAPLEPWKTYDPAAPGSSTLEALAPGEGFWVHTTRATTWTLRREVLYAACIPLQVGWNLIGWPLATEKALPLALERLAGGYAVVWTQRALPAPPAWLQFDPTAGGWANGLLRLAPGEGYWIRATQEQVLYIAR